MSFIVAPVYFDGTLHHNPAVNQNISTHCSDGDDSILKEFKEVLIEWDGDSWEEVLVFTAGQSVVALRVDNSCDDTFQYINVPFNNFRILGICCQNCPIAAVDASFILPDAVAGEAYAATFPILGNGPFSMNVLVKPDWMTITLEAGGNVSFTGNPVAPGDLDEEIQVMIEVNNCGKEATIQLDTTIGVYEAIAFTLRSAPAALYRDIIHDGSQFIAAGELVVSHSDDGITWVAGTNPGTPAGGNKVLAFKAGLYVLVRETISGVKRSFTSADGVTFAGGGTLPSNFDGIAGFCYDPVSDLFIALANAGTVRCATSPNGSAWTARTISNTVDWQRVRHLAGLNLAVGTDSVSTSTDGITWTPQTVPTGSWADVLHDGAQYMVISADGVNYLTSPDGVAWTPAVFDTQMPGGNIVGGIFANSQYILFSPNVSSNLHSIDGVHWHISTGGGIGHNIAFGDGLFAKAGNNGIYTSPGV